MGRYETLCGAPSGQYVRLLRGVLDGIAGVFDGIASFVARLFDRLADTPAVLGNPTVIAGVGVTHLRYPVREA